MRETGFVYAVARIRSAEMRLLSHAEIEQMLGAPDEAAIWRMLADRGWEIDQDLPGDALLQNELKRTWALLQEILPEEAEGLLNVLLVQNDYQNLKAVIKATGENLDPEAFLLYPTTLDVQALMQGAKERRFDMLPEEMEAAAGQAMDALLHEDDGQKCEMILDAACVEALYASAKNAKDDVLREWAALRSRSAVVQVAWRCARLNKNLDFVQRALPQNAGLDAEVLAGHCVEGEEALLSYLTSIGLDDMVQAMRRSVSAFEKYGDDLVMEKIRAQRYNPFGSGPLVAYYLAKENEVRVVRIVLAGKRNNLPEQAIRERLREMYG